MIARRPEYESRLYDALRESFGARARDGIHLSGLLAPRKEAWQNLVPLPPTDEELGYYTAGRGHEDAIARFLGRHFELTPEAVIDGIHLRPDFRAITDAVIPCGEYAEFKTRRANLPETDAVAQDAFSTYRAQIRGYMALLRRPRMYLIVLSLVEGKTQDAKSRSSPQFAIYEETMSEEEMAAERERLYAWRDALRRLRLLADLRSCGTTVPADVVERAIRVELALLPLCESWMCGKAYPRTITKPKCETCGQVFESAEFGPASHVASKRGEGHVITPAVMAWEYTPRCKWYEHCRPYEDDPSRGRR